MKKMILYVSKNKELILNHLSPRDNICYIIAKHMSPCLNPRIVYQIANISNQRAGRTICFVSDSWIGEDSKWGHLALS
jgi:hypothetical protein